jgi:2',3'-cyclic-nucleotide 2'-phosphodiesterase/3'-nucleotidase
LRILATSDLHAHLRSWDYLKNRPNPAVGLARTASLIAKARAERVGRQW